MKAAQIQSYGSAEQIEIKQVDIPKLKKDQILVAVHAAGVNPFDLKLMSGIYKEMIQLVLPYTIGGDFAGTVEEIGEDVTDFRPGDQVYGSASVAAGGTGSLAEYVAANISNTALKPTAANYQEAASLPLAAASAWQAINEHIQLKKDQKILIQGGAGGIGSLAIQLAKNVGAYVAATASGEAGDYLRKLGADEVIDYKNQNFVDIIRDFDAVYDTVGGKVAQDSVKVLKKGGILVSMTEKIEEKIAQEKGITAILQNTQTTSDKLEKIAGFVDRGILKAQIDRIFPLEESKQAFTYFENEHPNGKVVVDMER